MTAQSQDYGPAAEGVRVEGADGSSTGANLRLPVQPLLTVIARMCARAQCTESVLLEQCGLNPRKLHDWRSLTRARVTRDTADRVLSLSPYLWFDVWPECPEHHAPDEDCQDCVTYYRARYAFTGARLPLGMGRMR